MLPETRSAAQLSQILFAADWQPATFSPEKWAELVRSCELAGGFVCDETHQGKAKPASTSDARAQPEMGWLSLASIGVQDPIWTLPVEDEPDSYELMSPVSLEEESAAYIARLGIPIKDLWVMFGPTPGDPGDIRPVRSEKSMQELMRESNNTMFRESGNMLRVSNNGTRFPPGLLHEQVEGLLQACEDSLEAKPWVEWEADDQASARDPSFFCSSSLSWPVYSHVLDCLEYRPSSSRCRCDVLSASAATDDSAGAAAAGAARRCAERSSLAAWRVVLRALAAMRHFLAMLSRRVLRVLVPRGTF